MTIFKPLPDPLPLDSIDSIMKRLQDDFIMVPKNSENKYLIRRKDYSIIRRQLFNDIKNRVDIISIETLISDDFLDNPNYPLLFEDIKEHIDNIIQNRKSRKTHD